MAPKTGKGGPVPTTKKSAVHYRPAHHSAPFKTTAFPPGKSRLPPVVRPPSRRTPTPVSRMSKTDGAERGIVYYGGQGSVTGRSGIVCNRDEISGVSSVRSLQSSSCGKSSNNNATVRGDLTNSQSFDMHGICGANALSSTGIIQSALESSTGISNSGTILGDNITRFGEIPRTDAAKLETSAAIGQQNLSTSVATNALCEKTVAVDQSQPDMKLLHSKQNEVENSFCSSFLLCRDGQVLHVYKNYRFFCIYLIKIIICSAAANQVIKPAAHSAVITTLAH